MTDGREQFRDLDALLAAVCDQTAGPQDLQRIESLAGDPEGIDHVLDYLQLDGLLRWEYGLGADGVGSEFGEQVSDAPACPSAIGDRQSAIDALLPPPIIVQTSPAPQPPLFSLQSPLAVGLFSYAVALLIMGVMLLGAWAYKISHHLQIAETPAQVAPASDKPKLVFVGRITGMLDCKWSDSQTEAYAGASVPLGRKYALSSGLMEITYRSGAKVILQGPCTYEVESRAGGYLALGKLTAKVEAVEGKGSSSKVQGSRSSSLTTSHQPLATNSNPQSLTPNPFVVRTPVALVTDLGTEFGVEVSEEGNTTSHVFRGSVKVTVVGDGQKQDVVLRENESARVEKGDGKPSITRRAAGEASGFVLEMPPPKSARDSEAYAELVLSLHPVVYYRMERPKKGTGPIGAKHPAGRSGQLDLSPFSRVFDSAPSGHHGELRLGNEYGGSPYVPGRFGNALQLRGPAVCDWVIVPNYPKATDDRLTVSAWVLATGRPDWATIVSNWGYSELVRGDRGQFQLGLFRLDGDLRTRVTQRDGRRVEAREGAFQPFPLFVWQHVALVADGTALCLYRNGKQVVSGPCAGILPQPPVVSLCIGCRFTNQTGTDAALDMPGYNFWQGRIDEVAVFNQALSAETIQTLFLGKSLPNQTNTIIITKGEHPMNGP